MRLLINAGGRKYLLLGTEFQRSDRHSVRAKLVHIAEQLATELKDSWNEA